MSGRCALGVSLTNLSAGEDKIAIPVYVCYSIYSGICLLVLGAIFGDSDELSCHVRLLTNTS